MIRTGLCAALLLAASVASAQELRPGDRLELSSRLRVSQGQVGAVDEGVSDTQLTRSVLNVSRVKGALVEGLVETSAEGAAKAASKPVPYRGQLHDLAWLSAPRLLTPIAQELRHARAGERKVTLSIVGHPIDVRLRVVTVKAKRGRALRLIGSGEAPVGKTGVTLRLDFNGRVLLLPGGESRVQLRVRWTATGGPGQDAEARVQLETRVRKLAPETKEVTK